MTTLNFPILSDFEHPADLVKTLSLELGNDTKFQFSVPRKKPEKRPIEIVMATLIVGELAFVGGMISLLVKTLIDLHNKKLDLIENEKQRRLVKETTLITVIWEGETVQIPLSIVDASREEQRRYYQKLEQLREIKRIELLRE